MAPTSADRSDSARIERELIALNESALNAYIVHNDVGPLAELALQDFFMLGPAGVESREHVMATVGNLDVQRLRVDTSEVRVFDASAVLAGTLHIQGRVGDQPMPSLGFLSVYVWRDDAWRLAARSLTPLIGR